MFSEAGWIYPWPDEGRYSVGAQEPESVDQLHVFAERRIMFGETEQLKQKLEEMLASNDTGWVNAVTVTLNAMYRQFRLEQQDASRLFLLVLAGYPNLEDVGLTAKGDDQSGA